MSSKVCVQVGEASLADRASHAHMPFPFQGVPALPTLSFSVSVLGIFFRVTEVIQTTHTTASGEEKSKVLVFCIFDILIIIIIILMS